MPGSKMQIVKGKILTRADNDLNAPTQAHLDGLKAAASLSQHGVNRGVLLAGDKAHVDEEWLGNDWWPTIPDKEAIIREGYIKALELALDGAVRPVVSYWVVGVPTFEVMVAQSAQQITVFLMTPTHPPATLPPPEQAIVDGLFVVASTARVEEIRDSFPAGYEMNSLIKDSFTAGIKRLQSKGY